MRTPDAEELGIANVEHAWKALGHGEQQAAGRSKASSEGRSRARKGMKRKKQPQRGLGVAQLEKLRMQEQSKIMGQDQVGAMYLRRNINAGALSHQHHHHTNQWPLAVLNSRLIHGSPAPDRGHMMHHGGRGGTMDVGDLLWTFMSPDQSRSVMPLSRLEHGHTVMSIMVPLGADDSEASGMCNHDHRPHIAAPLGRNVHDRSPSRVNNLGTGTIADRLPRELPTSVPVVAGHCDKSKELSSVQNISSNHPRSAKACGWKRPWQALYESQPMHSNRCLDLMNTSSTFAADMDSGHLAVGHKSAHQSEGLVWEAAPGDCSSHPLDISLFGTRPSEVLTLGLSSFDSVMSAQHEDRVESQEAISTSQGNRLHVDMCSKGGCGDNLQLHLCNPQQAQVQQMRSFPVVADEARFRYRFSSESLTEQCHKQTERKTEESLDLRLKLAI